MKKAFSRELCYAVGMVILCLGTALMEKGGYGLSMVIAPAYILSAKLSPVLPWFSFGVASYLYQLALILLASVVVRRFRVSYLLSFVTAVIHGYVLDAAVWLVSFVPDGGVVMRVLLYIAGTLISTMGLSFVFRTYLPTEAHELFVKLVTEKWSLPLRRVKTAYDCSSCALALVLSVVFFGFGSFVGIGIGTIVCAFVNGTLIGAWSKLFDRWLGFKDTFGWRKFLERF